MWFKLLLPSKIRFEPIGSAETVGDAFADEIGRKTGEKDDWIELKIRTGGGASVRGWLKKTRAEPCDEPPRPELNLWGFLKHCVNAELWINNNPATSPHYIVADYLIALANIESKLKNAGELTAGSGAVGPFQFTEERWQRFTAASDDDMFDADDREDALDQVFGAAYLAYLDTKAISDGVGQLDLISGIPETSGETGPFLPSLVDVFLAHIVGAAEAVKFRALKFADKGETPVDQVLRETITAPELARLLAQRRDFLMIDGERVETTDGMYAKIETRLDQELKDAFKLIETHTPEDLPPALGNASWLAKAQEQEALWADESVSETSASGRTLVKSYLAASNLHTSDNLPWCGAFAAFCMREAGLGATVPNGSARAANWKQWGTVSIPLGSSEIPQGAVVVLSPAPGSGRSGHVGFYTRHLTGEAQVELLGGNQRDRVKLSKFPRNKIVAIRWQGEVVVDEDISSPVTGIDVLLEVIGRVESRNNYNAYFAHAGNTDQPLLTGMTIKKVRAFQDKIVANGLRSSASGRYQIIRKTLDGLRSKMGLSGNELFDQAMQDKMAVALLRGRGLDKFKARKISATQFANNIAMEWASMPVATGPNAGSSFYDGDGLNKALVSVGELMAAINKIA